MYNNQYNDQEQSPTKEGNSNNNNNNNNNGQYNRGHLNQRNQQNLANRLYDKGFNLSTMPSVKREQIKSLASIPNSIKQASQFEKQNSVTQQQLNQNVNQILQSPKKPLMRVKLNSYSSRSKKLEPIKYQQLSVALHEENQGKKQKKNRKNQEHDEHMYEEEEMDEYSSNQQFEQTRGQFGNFTQSQFNKSTRKSNKNFSQTKTFFGQQQQMQDQQQVQSQEKFGFGVKDSLLESGIDFKSQMHKTQQIFNLPSLQHKPAGLPQMGMTMKSGFSTSQDNFFESVARSVPRKFEPIEEKQTKFLVDKISGKFNIDKRYIEKNKKRQFLSSQEQDQNQQQENKGGDSGVKQRSTKLDIYIDYVLKGVTNIEQYLYLIRVSDDDPYDLDVTSYETIKRKQEEEGLKEYYIISRKGLCHYVNDKPIEFIQLGYWIKERETYDQIISLNFFTKFRKWKTLKMWRKNVVKEKIQTYAKDLEEKLFILNPILRNTLLEYRSQTHSMMETVRFITFQAKEKYKAVEDGTYTLETFKQMQVDQREKVTTQIQNTSKSCKEKVLKGFDDSLNMLRKNQSNPSNQEDLGGQKQGSSNFFRLKESAYQSLGFKDNMTYERRSELRKECSKFLRFSYLVDFIALESLSQIYVLSCSELESKIRELTAQQVEYIVTEAGQRGGGQHEDPLFQLHIEEHFDEIPNEYIDSEMISTFQPHPIGTSRDEDFNPLYHIEMKKTEEEEENAKNRENDDDQKIKRLIVPKITDLWLKVTPDKDAFSRDIIKCITEGRSAIQVFERWSRSDHMTKYVSVLEEWDEHVSSDWQNPDSNYLNPSDWIEQNDSDLFSNVYKPLIDEAYEKCEKWKRRQFQSFLTINWELSRFDTNIFKEFQNFDNSQMVFEKTLLQLTNFNEINQQKLPLSADLGLFRVEVEKLRKKLLPKPQELIAQLQQMMPQVLLEKMKVIKEWMKSSYENMKMGSIELEDFVDQQQALAKIQDPKNGIVSQKEKLSEIESIIVVLKKFDFPFKTEQLQAFNDNQVVKKLEEAIQKSEENASKKTEIFAKRIKTQLWPELQREVIELDGEVGQQKYIEGEMEAEEAIKELGGYMEKLKQQLELSKKYNHYEEILNMELTVYEELENLKVDLKNKYDMWVSSKEWKDLMSSWLDSEFNDIQTDQIKEKVEFYDKIVKRCSKDLPAGIPTLTELKSTVDEFKNQIPIVRALRNQKLQSVHWEQIFQKTGQEFDVGEAGFTLRKMIDMKLGQFKDEIQEISTQATQEDKLKQELEKVEKEWLQLQMETTEHKKEGKGIGVKILTEVDDLNTNLDEILANMNNILGSRYLKQLRKKAEDLLKNVLNAQDCIGDWVNVQRNWMYLEGLFQAQEIKNTMKEESAAFDKVDKYFKDQMRKASQKGNVHLIIDKNSKKNWEKNKDTLNSIQKALDALLEQKRNIFPRFYFLSNDELLEIMANSSVQQVEKNLKKCFDGINSIKWEGQQITHMISPEGEVVKLTKSLNLTKEVEVWLGGLEKAMKDSMRSYIKKGQQNFEKMVDNHKNEWVLQEFAQVVATVDNIQWTLATEAAIQGLENDPDSLASWVNAYPDMVGELTDMITKNKNLTTSQRRSVVALITQDVHARDILFGLLDNDVTQIRDFAWQKELRYYSEGEDVRVKQVNAEIKYGFEYMGATTRLVITKLTDRCWMTITGALNIQLGAAPAGPAGTGKTESTKDLGKALGLLCIVFNCSDQIEYKMMQRLFAGLCEQGAWACLDEFNRIDIEVLSVVAQQLQTIKAALGREETEFMFGDYNKKINLKADGYGVFITMNPGYAGRTELPDNLKVQFRPVAMMIPDYGSIAEIMLFAEGFKDASSLSKKMVRLYKLSSEQLSQQDHYDFGMRAVKSVLNMAGKLKGQLSDDQNQDESELLIRAMRDSNVPKFLKQDLPLFSALIQDLFPDAVIQEPDYGQLPEQIVESIDKLGLQFNKNLETKVIQLYETFAVRFGVMIVGYTNSGKTSCFKILQNAMTELYNKDQKGFYEVLTHILNPKCISMGELYGEVNIYTQEWTDGLASQIMREGASSDTDQRQWVVFDGPVDALWIENMNTVLDDNKMLCLANGQRIKLRDEMRMLFEVNDLRVASPATVSRCGMVYMMQEDLGWQPYVKSWLTKTYGDQKSSFGSDIPQQNQLNQELQEHILGLFEKSVDEFLELMRSKMTEPIETNDLQLVVSLCNLFESLLFDLKGFPRGEEKVDQQKRFITYIFTFAFIWSMGSTCDDEHWAIIDVFVKEKFPSALFPMAQTVYSYYLDTSDLQFKHWDQIVQPFEYDPSEQYFNMLVPTVDTTRFSYIMEYLLNKKKHIYVTGATGVGKSVVVSGKLTDIKEKRGIDQFQLIFSAQTSSYTTQLAIESKLSKYNKSLLSAAPGRKNCIFIDDVNMPAVEEYGAQPPIELLRLLVDKEGFYDRKERFWKDIKEFILLVCSAPPGGGRSNVTQRFSKHFNILNFPQPNNDILVRIFESLVKGFFEKCRFTDSVKQTADGMVRGTISIYQKIMFEKKPIPAKFHYTFNLRDVSKVFMGILMVSNTKVRDENTATKLWIHENSRVFHDRLINDEDREWFYDAMMEILGREFKPKFEKDQIFKENPIQFTDLLKIGGDVRYYELVEEKDQKKLESILVNQLDDYNYTYPSKMNLSFFKECKEHILRISRILRSPRGSAMLIGVGGSGKQSLTKLATFMLEYEIRSIEIVKGYNINNFREFLKEIMKKVGQNKEGKGLTFLFTDTQILEEGFLEDINNILNSGEVPNLWLPDEKTVVIDDTRELNEKKKRNMDPDTIYKTFVEKVRNDLHIVLCMSPVGSSLRVRCRKFPSLVDCCGLDWFSSWPAEALVSVAMNLLSDGGFPVPKQMSRDKILESLSQISKDVHLEATEMTVKFEEELKRKVYTTPKSYLDLIKLYTYQLGKVRTKISKQKDRLFGGVTKLQNAKEQIALLKEQLVELEPILVEKSKQVEIAQKEVNKDKEIADRKEELVQEETDIVMDKKQDIENIKNEAEAELNVVMPQLLEAQKKVEDLDKGQLIPLRTMANPPKVVEKVFQAVLILLGEKDQSWKTAQKQLQDLNKFMNSLINYDKENISERILKKLREVLKQDFDIEVIKSKVSYLEGIATFCLAMDKFADVNAKVKPKKEKVAELQIGLDKANADLSVKQAELNEVKEKVEQLNKELQKQMKLKQELDFKKKQTTLQLDRAGKLIVLTADESVRWKATCETLDEQIEYLFGDIFLCVAAISYNGPFTGVYREELLKKWKTALDDYDIPNSGKYDIVKTMGDPMKIREWTINGLPSDSISQENSIFTIEGHRWPLLIDPQLQARKWIINMEKAAAEKMDIAQETFFILSFSHPDFIRKMSLAIQNGYSVLIEDVDETLDPSIDTILGKDFYESPDGRTLIKFAEKEIDYDSRFKLYMMTKKPNPNYLAEIYIKVTVINFTATFEGLNDQLLANVVVNERPEVEIERNENVIKLAKCKNKIEECEASILNILEETDADKMLDDDRLVSTLETSKLTSQEISIELEKSEKDEIRINEIRNQFTKVSIRGSILYFVIKDLALIDPMYQYSLQAVIKLFDLALKTAKQDEDQLKRIDNLIDSITKTMYSNVCRGLFEQHKLIFSFLMSSSINKHADILDNAKFQIFLKGAATVHGQNYPQNPDVDRIPNISWKLACFLDQEFEVFQGLPNSISNQNKFKLWLDYIQCEDPIKQNLPDGWQDKLDIFEKMLIIKILRPEKLMFAVSNYVEHYMTKFYLEPPPQTLQNIYNDSNNISPIVFILSQGADPTSQIEQFAKTMNFEEKLNRISLGQGQGPKAQALIEEGKLNGNWVFLQNCHLDKTFMPTLETIVNNFEDENKEGKIDENFRLFLTSMPAPYFPVAVLQASIKVTNEPPRGLKANLKRSWIGFDEKFLEHKQKPEEFQKLVWGLTYFHAIIQERRKFGPLGWNIRYEFNDSDLECSIMVMRNLISESEDIPWDSLNFVSGHINYGGRVTDDWDRRCLLSILSKFYTTDILQEEYKFSENPQYKIPVLGDISSYRDYIETLDLQDDPAVFGMHENANITYQQQESNKILETVLSIQPRSSGGKGGKSSDDIILELIANMLEQLPDLMKLEEGNQQLFEVNDKGLIKSLSTVLLQEITKFNGLITIISTTLKDLEKAISGLMVMSSTLDSVYSSMLKNQVPNIWQKYPSLKPLGSWITDLEERVKFMNDWLMEGNPICYWMSGMFFPQGFLTGVLQEHARNYNIAIDSIEFKYRILAFDKEQCTIRPTDGVYIYGLFLEGAKWDRKKNTLVDSDPGIMYTNMPVICFQPTQIQSLDQSGGSLGKSLDCYECPVYKTSTRAGVLSTTGQSTNFVIAVDLPSLEQDQDYWIQRGAAMLCQLDY